MADQLQLRGGTTTEHSTFTGALREVTVDTDKDTLIVHDAATAGGHPLLREDGSNSALSLGTAGTPSIKFTGDTNTGIYSPGADQVAISTGGAGRLFVDSSGNVGVGQSSPVVYFDIFKSGATQADLRVRNGTSGLNLAIKADGTADIANVLNYPITFTTGTTPGERLRIDSSGRVGIGTSAPSSLFEVDASFKVKAQNTTTIASERGLTVYQNQSNGFVDSTLVYGNTANSYFALGHHNGTSYSERLRIDSSGRVGIGTASPTYLCNVLAASGSQSIFQAGQTGISNGYTITSNGTNLTHAWFNGGNEAVRIDSSGRVGIGTSSPSYPLHIVTPAVSGRQNLSNISRTTSNWIRVTNPQYSTDASVGLLLRVFPDSDTRQGAGILASGGTDNNSTELDLFYTNTSGTSLSGLKINSSGNVGVGTTSPGEKLHVVGSGVRIDRTGGDPYIDFYTSGSANNVALYGGSSTGFRAFVGGSERLRIDSSGRVGIGTSSPGALLHASAAGAISGLNEITRVESTAADSGPSFTFYGKQGSDASTKISGLIGFTQTNNADSNGRPAFVLHTGNNGSVTEKLRVTHDGLVGIGTTTVTQKCEIGDGSDAVNYLRIHGSTSDLYLGASNTGTNLGITNGTKIISVDAYPFAIGTTVTQPLILGTDNFERARITSSGQLLVGTSTARSNFYNTTVTSAVQVEGTTGDTSSLAVIANRSGSPSRLILASSGGSTVGSNTVVSSGNGAGSISFQASDGTQFVQTAEINAEIDGTPGANDMPGRLVFSTTADGASSPTERMQITNAGEIRTRNGGYFSGTNNGDAPYSNAPIVLQNTSNNTNVTVIQFKGWDGTLSGSISTRKAVTTYSTSSDYRLKENVVAIDDGIARVKQLNPSRFNFTFESETTVDGFLAHEAQAVVPEAVIGTKDAVDDEGNPVYQGIDQSKLVPLLTAALQEAIAKIETLETKVAALEAN